jgi:4-amino-4-deoxy-L-arabinose transferase-like glycosyltransferase
MILVYIALARLALHLFTNGGYGYARDELYYIACGNHLDWGYVDHPPLTPLLARFVASVAGTSLAAVRFLPAVAAAATTFIAGRTARELGGKLWAQVLTAVAVTVGYSSLLFGTLMTTNVFDHLLWAAALYLFVVILVRGDGRRWLWLGVVLGLGLMNKHSMVFLGGALFAGLVLCDERKRLASRWPWYAAGVALLVFLPNIVWEVQHGWPTLEFLRRAEINRMPRVAPWSFFVGQVFSLHILLVPVWLLGLWRSLMGKEEERLRPVGLAYLALFVYFLLSRAKAYYLVPFYPPLLALGWVWIERRVDARRLRWAPAAAVVLLLVGGAVTAPLAIPILPPETLVRYAPLVDPSLRRRPAGQSKMPAAFQDMFGWEEMVAAVAEVYHALPQEQREVAAISGNNYGQSAAIDFFGPKYGLPKSVCSHNSYWYWGPRDYTGEVFITVGVRKEALQGAFASVELAAVVEHPHVVWYENNQPVYVWRGMVRPLPDLWPRMKLFY